MTLEESIRERFADNHRRYSNKNRSEPYTDDELDELVVSDMEEMTPWDMLGYISDYMEDRPKQTPPPSPEQSAYAERVKEHMHDRAVTEIALHQKPDEPSFVERQAVILTTKEQIRLALIASRPDKCTDDEVFLVGLIKKITEGQNA